MLTFFARPFVLPGEQLAEIHAILIFKEDNKPLDSSELSSLLEHMSDVLKLCEDLNLPVSKQLFTEARTEPPGTNAEFDIMKKALYAELTNKLMVYVPSHRRKYYHHKDFIDPKVLKEFPGSHSELRAAGQSFSVGLYTATVFHAMRAVELGLRTMAKALEVEIPNLSHENVDWETLIRQIESKVTKMKDLPRTDDKADKLHFYSEACMQFRYFKDGWRVRTAHVKAVYDEPQAQSALDHAVSFFKTLSTKLKEDFSGA